MADIHVCIAAEQFYPAFSGAALRFKGYIPGLVERGFGVEVLCGSPTRNVAYHGTLVTDTEQETVDGIRVFRVDLPDTRSRHRRQAFARAVAAHAERMDGSRRVIQLLALGPGFRTALRHVTNRGVATVYSGTMVAEPHPNPLKQARRKYRLTVPMSRVDRVVASTSVMADYFRSLGVTTPIEIIPNGVDLDRFHPVSSPEDRESLRKRLSIESDSRVALFVGSVSPRKGLDRLLSGWAEICARIPEAKLIVVGPGPDARDPALAEYRRRIETLLTSSGARDRVRFEGVADNVAEYMRAADVLVFPTRREGMGNVVLEAMASGLPVVLTPFIGLPDEFGSPGGEYVLTQEDPASIASAVTEVLSSSSRAADLARAGRSWVERYMDIGATVDAYADLYRRVADPFHTAPSLQGANAEH